MITNEQLRATFVSPAMKFYFDRKLAPLDGAEVDARVDELLKYLNMATHSHGGIPFNDDIDDVWHLWIMQTKEYAALCRKLQGAKFIHHSSNEYEAFADPDVKTRPMDTQRAVGVLRSYVINYGPFGADRVRYWPVAEQLVQRLGWSVERLNEWLAQPVHRAAPVQHAGAIG
jgi:hypothetical protein